MSAGFAGLLELQGIWLGGRATVGGDGPKGYAYRDAYLALRAAEARRARRDDDLLVLLALL